MQGVPHCCARPIATNRLEADQHQRGHIVCKAFWSGKYSIAVLAMTVVRIVSSAPARSTAASPRPSSSASRSTLRFWPKVASLPLAARRPPHLHRTDNLSAAVVKIATEAYFVCRSKEDQ